MSKICQIVRIFSYEFFLNFFCLDYYVQISRSEFGLFSNIYDIQIITLDIFRKTHLKNLVITRIFILISQTLEIVNQVYFVQKHPDKNLIYLRISKNSGFLVKIILSIKIFLKLKVNLTSGVSGNASGIPLVQIQFFLPRSQH